VVRILEFYRGRFERGLALGIVERFGENIRGMGGAFPIPFYFPGLARGSKVFLKF